MWIMCMRIDLSVQKLYAFPNVCIMCSLPFPGGTRMIVINLIKQISNMYTHCNHKHLILYVVVLCVTSFHRPTPQLTICASAWIYTFTLLAIDLHGSPNGMDSFTSSIWMFYVPHYFRWNLLWLCLLYPYLVGSGYPECAIYTVWSQSKYVIWWLRWGNLRRKPEGKCAFKQVSWICNIIRH